MLLRLELLICLLNFLLKVILELWKGLGWHYKQAVFILAGLLLSWSLLMPFEFIRLVAVHVLVLRSQIAQYLQWVRSYVFVDILYYELLHVFIFQQIILKLLQVSLHWHKWCINAKTLANKLGFLQFLFLSVLWVYDLKWLGFLRKRRQILLLMMLLIWSERGSILFKLLLSAFFIWRLFQYVGDVCSKLSDHSEDDILDDMIEPFAANLRKSIFFLTRDLQGDFLIGLSSVDCQLEVALYEIGALIADQTQWLSKVIVGYGYG